MMVNVLIPTRPGGRVQHFGKGLRVSHSMFQSSPDPEAGCNEQVSLSPLKNIFCTFRKKITNFTAIRNVNLGFNNRKNSYYIF